MQPFNHSSSYEEFLAKLRRSLRDQGISESILSLLKNGFEKGTLFCQGRREFEPIIQFQKKYWLT